jgi:hypothetical protein
MIIIFIFAFFMLQHVNKKPSQAGAPIKARDDLMELNNANK